MKNFTFKIALIISMLLLSLSLSQSVHAQAGSTGGVNPTGGSTGGVKSSPVQTLQNPLQVDSIGALVENFAVIFSYIVVLIGVLLLIWVGFRYVLARGNPTELTKLHGWLLWIIVGIAIVIGARLIIQVVINTLSATGTINPQVIQSAQNAIQTHN